ncbi:g9971 [Coccomyxa viridis]|uniref:G9971 protein n=1 Tax=Coccomyxa viridis TaxID=1274662 RepID=A0ABP1G4L1_9CHLO
MQIPEPHLAASAQQEPNTTEGAAVSARDLSVEDDCDTTEVSAGGESTGGSSGEHPPHSSRPQFTVCVLVTCQWSGQPHALFVLRKEGTDNGSGALIARHLGRLPMAASASCSKKEHCWQLDRWSKSALKWQRQNGGEAGWLATPAEISLLKKHGAITKLPGKPRLLQAALTELKRVCKGQEKDVHSLQQALAAAQPASAAANRQTLTKHLAASVAMPGMRQQCTKQAKPSTPRPQQPPALQRTARTDEQPLQAVALDTQPPQDESAAAAAAGCRAGNEATGHAMTAPASAREGLHNQPDPRDTDSDKEEPSVPLTVVEISSSPTQSRSRPWRWSRAAGVTLSLPKRLRSARDIRPPNRLDPSPDGSPQWATAKRTPGQWDANLAGANTPRQRRRWTASIAALGARPHSSLLPSKRALASQATKAPPCKRPSTGVGEPGFRDGPAENDGKASDPREVQLEREINEATAAPAPNGHINKERAESHAASQGEDYKESCKALKAEVHALHIQQGQSKAIQTGLRAELQLKTEEAQYLSESCKSLIAGLNALELQHNQSKALQIDLEKDLRSKDNEVKEYQGKNDSLHSDIQKLTLQHTRELEELRQELIMQGGPVPSTSTATPTC